MLHDGVLATSSPSSPPTMPPEDVDRIFTLIKSQLFADKKVVSSEIQVGQHNVFITVPTVRAQNIDSYDSYKENGNRSIYAMMVMRYRDDISGSGKYIYTESCIYIIKMVQHFCEGGHNQSYIQ
jgi:hypothetical protein